MSSICQCEAETTGDQATWSIVTAPHPSFDVRHLSCHKSLVKIMMLYSAVIKLPPRRVLVAGHSVPQWFILTHSFQTLLSRYLAIFSYHLHCYLVCRNVESLPSFLAQAGQRLINLNASTNASTSTARINQGVRYGVIRWIGHMQVRPENHC